MRMIERAAVVEARADIVGLEAAEAHLSQVHTAEVPGLGTGDELTVQRHVQDSGCVHEHDAVGAGKLTRLVELGGVQGDGLLAKHVLARGQAGAQVGDVGVVRGGDVDGVDVRVGAKLLERAVDSRDAMGGGEGLGLGKGAILHAGEGAPSERERLRHLVGDHATTDDGPAQLRGSKDVGRELLALRGGEGGLRSGFGVERGGGGVGHVSSFDSCVRMP